MSFDDYGRDRGPAQHALTFLDVTQPQSSARCLLCEREFIDYIEADRTPCVVMPVEVTR